MKITLNKPRADSPLDQVLEYLKYDHNKRHILFAYRLLASLELKRNAAVADLGCGGCETLMVLDRMGFEDITAVDYDEGVLDSVNNNFGGDIKTFWADFNEPLPLGSESLDVVTSFEAIEHVVSAEFFLSEIKRVLRKGGRLLITTPNHAFYKSRWRALKGERLGKEGVHLRFFTKDHFEEILENAGFTIEKRGSLGHLPLVNREPWRSVLRRKRVHHYIPEKLESLFAINFIWLCRKA